MVVVTFPTQFLQKYLQFSRNNISATRKTFPDDILIKILDFTWRDKHDLCSFSLVCGSWFTVAHPYMYRRVTIESDEDLSQLEQLLGQNTVPLQSWIRELVLIVSPSRDEWIFNSEFSTKLPALHDIQLHTTSGQMLPDLREWATNAGLPHLQNLHTLRLNQLARGGLTVAELSDLVCLLPRLRHLKVSIQTFHQVEEGAYIPPEPTFLSDLESVHITLTWLVNDDQASVWPPIEFLQWMARPSNLKIPRLLKLSGEMFCDHPFMDAANSLIIDPASATVVLNIGYTMHGARTTDIIDTNVRVQLRNEDGRSVAFVQCFTRNDPLDMLILFKHHSRVETIFLTAMFEGDSTCSLLMDLDRFFASDSRFPRLKRVYMFPERRDKGTYAKMEKTMVKCSARGLVDDGMKIQCKPDELQPDAANHGGLGLHKYY
ncbi:unnamed protein product [Somion occarium]|uniref:F-box domain-containing protein n=1 Tax=Somion occarium TaxID=3059160 RepID=A0ABP1D535_9APHY